jgi:hypothetical protein
VRLKKAGPHILNAVDERAHQTILGSAFLPQYVVSMEVNTAIEIIDGFLESSDIIRMCGMPRLIQRIPISFLMSACMDRRFIDTRVTRNNQNSWFSTGFWLPINCICESLSSKRAAICT